MPWRRNLKPSLRRRIHNLHQLQKFAGLAEDAIDGERAECVLFRRAQLTGLDDDFPRETRGPEFLHQLKAAKIRHLMIRDDKVVGVGIGGQTIPRFLPVTHRFDLVPGPLEQSFHKQADLFVIVGAEYVAARLWHGTPAAGVNGPSEEGYK